mmetsp:Transcript_82996/g.162716  ORF Transcript_82996/g.162716 Transcript_82996/m.162716 type:complete len:227 (-) Transcript_82996:621-1301(-)
MSTRSMPMSLLRNCRSSFITCPSNRMSCLAWASKCPPLPSSGARASGRKPSKNSSKLTAPDSCLKSTTKRSSASSGCMSMMPHARNSACRARLSSICLNSSASTFMSALSSVLLKIDFSFLRKLCKRCSWSSAIVCWCRARAFAISSAIRPVRTESKVKEPRKRYKNQKTSIHGYRSFTLRAVSDQLSSVKKINNVPTEWRTVPNCMRMNSASIGSSNSSALRPMN